MGESGERSHVIARVEIPSGAKSPPFNLTLSSQIQKKHHLPIQVSLTQNGEIRLSTSNPTKDTSRIFPHVNPDSLRSPSSVNWSWIRIIQFAPDCHVQNVRICRWQSDALILEATKTIPAGHELFLWFGEDVLVNDLGIPPYLNPQNILGGKNYTCHKCGKEFEAPNPLKVHLALSCGSLSVDVVWSRMATIRTMTSSTLNLRIVPPTPPSPALTPYPFGLLSAPNFFLPLQRMDTSGQNSVSATGPETESIRQHRPIFLPQEFRSGNNGSKIPKSATTVTVTANQNMTGFVPMPTTTMVNTHSKSFVDQQAHLESIMSNMGRGKNGHHVCVYCGKLYSRKYGLKIHIRTHTGFKPLQCKICHRPFGDPSNLNKHVRLHSDGNTPYRCDICGKVLVRRRDLDRHIRSRHSTFSLPTQQSAIDCSIKHNNNGSIPINSNSSPLILSPTPNISINTALR